MKTSRVLVSGFVLACIVFASIHAGSVVSEPVPQTSNPGEIQVAGSIPLGDYPTIQPVSGPQKTLAILVEFSNAKHNQSQVAIDSVIFGEVAKYYAEVSYGRIQIVGKSVGWYALPHTMAYYGADIDPSQPGSDARRVDLIRDAVDAVPDPAVFSGFAHIIVVHAGIGQEDSVKQSDLIWSEAIWSGLGIQTRSGATVDAAAIVPEMESNGHSVMGVCAHEFGHLLSLPDLYDHNGNYMTPDPFLGRWSLMATGLWLGDPRGSSPAELEAWSRIKLGWLAPDSMELVPGNVSLQLETLQPIETATGVRAIQIPTSGNDYYLVEFRKKVSFDSYLPSNGILVTRIDETRSTGEGIVQVIDANQSSRTLNDATYAAGGKFTDRERNVFIDILSNSSESFSVLVGNQEPPSLPLTMTSIAGPHAVNATYSQPTAISAKLTDQHGKGLEEFPVRLQYFGNGQWNDFEATLTDSQGIANFQGTFPLQPGEYTLRLFLAGGKYGDHYVVGSDQQLELNLRKVATSLVIEGPLSVQAMQESTFSIRVSDEFGQPMENMRVVVWLDNQLIQNEVISNSTVTFAVNLGLDQIGTHNVRVEVNEDPLHTGTEVTRPLDVTAPAWVYALIALIILAPVSVAYLRFRQRLVSRLFKNP
jgi:M6 family metalloprotease-like protein